MNIKKIPLFNVFMTNDIDKPILEVLHSGYIGEGDKVVRFEEIVAQYTGNKNVLTLNNGTAALHLAYQMALYPDSQKGYFNDNIKEVITSPMTCTATNCPIISNGAKIVWADINPITGNIDPKSIEEKITKNTKAISMIHWGGNPCEIDQINNIAKKNNIFTIEDGAHSMGMEYKGKKVGNHSDFTMISLQAIKHINSIDGGLLFTKNKKFYDRAKLLRWYGIDRTIREGRDLRCELDVVEAGYKFHMNDVCATVGYYNFLHVEEILKKHRDNARFYDQIFKEAGNIIISPENPDGKSSYWLYTIHIQNRDELMKKLNESGIGASKVHARNDTHSMFNEFKCHLPNVEKFNSTHLCIPVGWWVTESDRDYIAEMVLKYAK